MEDNWNIRMLGVTLEACLMSTRRDSKGKVQEINITDAILLLVDEIQALRKENEKIAKAEREAIRAAGESISKAITTAAFGDELVGRESPIIAAAKIVSTDIREAMETLFIERGVG